MTRRSTGLVYSSQHEGRSHTSGVSQRGHRTLPC
jgi:hypothetical protein